MYKLVLAIRYLVKRRISYFAVFAAALCVFVSFTVITVLSGLMSEFKMDAYRGIGDCVVSSKSLVGFAYYEDFVDRLRGSNFVEGVSPVIRSPAVVKANREGGETDSEGYVLEIMGIDPVSHSRVTAFGQWLFHHKGNVGEAFDSVYEPNMPGCVPGVRFLFKQASDGSYEIDERRSRVGLEVSVLPLTAKGAPAKAGTGEINTKSFYYSDHVDSESGYFDWHRLFLPFEEAQVLCGMGTGIKRANALFVKFKPGIRLGAGCAKVRRFWQDFVESKVGASQANTLEGVRVQDWKTYSRYIIAIVETQQTFMMVIFAMIGIITVFIAFVVFYMIICHKSKDVGILRSIGFSRADVLSLFLGFAVLIGIVGSAIGAVCGWWYLLHIEEIEVWMFEHFEFRLFRGACNLADVPSAINPTVLGATMLAAIGACILGAFLPSWQAAKKEPVETLQVSQL